MRDLPNCVRPGIKPLLSISVRRFFPIVTLALSVTYVYQSTAQMTGNPVITCHIILVCQVIIFTLAFSVSRSYRYRFFVLALRLARGEQDVVVCSKFRISKGIRRFHRLSKCLACCVNRHAIWLFCGKVVSSFSKSRKRRQHETDTLMVPLKQPLMLRALSAFIARGFGLGAQ